MTVVVSLCLSFSFSIPVFASESGETDIINEMISYYSTYQSTAKTDIQRLVEKLKALNSTKGEEWEKIMEYWDYVNSDMNVNVDVLPDGLPNDDSLCITVLGFALNDDGTMKDELVGRLQTALASAQKYPNAYVAVTGGGTAKNNPNATEADQMAAWMIANGLDKNRLIVENKSKSTVQNAQFTYAILREKYPTIKSLAIVTSDYHVQRGCLLYYSQLLLSAYDAGDNLLDVISNAGYKAGHEGYESISLQAMGLKQIAGIRGGPQQEAPELSTLTDIEITGETSYKKGDELQLSVTGIYTTPDNETYKRDITDEVEMKGYDATQIGKQNVTVAYTENDISLEKEIEVSVIEETVKKDETVTTPTTEDKVTNKINNKKTQSTTAVKTGDNTSIGAYSLLALLSVLLTMLLKKYRFE